MSNVAAQTACSKAYVYGWMPLLVLLALPTVEFVDILGVQLAGVFLLVLAGYAAVRAGEQRRARSAITKGAPSAQIHFRAVILFSLLSIIGCRLVHHEQASYLGDASFESLQERYIALVESSLEGSSTSSIWSSIGNLLRAFFFIAITSFVVFTKLSESRVRKLALTALIAFALMENFGLNVSRLQFVFLLLTAVIAAGLIDHPLLRRKWLIAGAVSALIVFLLLTTAQRFDAKFDDSSVAAEYVANFFGVQVQPLGQLVVDRFGLAAFSLSMYLTQGVPELIRLIANNDSPYSLGSHSLYLLLAPLLRLFGLQLTSDQPISNQGVWWGFMGDLYLDFGIVFPVVYLAVLYLMVRAAERFGNGPVYGFTLRSLTAGMILIVPYTGIFNTYAVSYFGVLLLAAREKRELTTNRKKNQGTGTCHGIIAEPSVRT